MPILLDLLGGDQETIPWTDYRKVVIKKQVHEVKKPKAPKEYRPPSGKGCEFNSPIYRQIMREVAQGYEFVSCDKTNKIVRRKKLIK